MTSVKLGIIGDAHLGCSDFTEKRRADFAVAFTNAVETCRRAQAGAICLLGDVFDSALMRRNIDAFAATIREVGPLLDRLRRDGVPVLAIAGNHEFGRGREAGELSVLESLGFLRVLRNEAITLADVTIAGLPWHAPEDVPLLAGRAKALADATTTRARILLLHNFVKGSRNIPAFMGEVDAAVARGFDRVFVGHHHDREEVGPFVMPGATEVQNLAEAESEKSVALYDTSSQSVSFLPLPRTHRVIVLAYDVGVLGDHDALLRAIAADLGKRDARGAFVCVRVTGVTPAGPSVTRAEIVALLRGHDVFDRYVELRVTSQVREARDVISGTTIDSLLRREFATSEGKAREYITTCTDDDFAERIVSDILR